MTIQVPRSLVYILAALLTLLATSDWAHAADWRQTIDSYDSARLADLGNARDRALDEARHRSGTGDVRAINEIFSPAGHDVPEGALTRNWRCRQVKLGGMTGYAVFSWFPCRISKVNGGLWFQKNGTQRMAGYLYPENGAWVYLGAQSARGEPIHRYSGNGASVGAVANPDDQVGVLTGIGNNRLRIDLPSPATQESDFDAIELVR